MGGEWWQVCRDVLVCIMVSLDLSRCGLCGDSWDAEVKDHEAPGGKYANGVIVRQYRPGQIIRVTSHITANHAGFVDFKLCRNNNINQDPSQDCFDLPEASLAVVEAGHVR